MDRVKALESFISANPTDPFPRYGLAMEHKNAGDLAEARKQFADLVGRCPDYVATYLMYGNTLAQLGEATGAAKVYRDGLAIAEQAGDSHTASELRTALANVDEG